MAGRTIVARPGSSGRIVTASRKPWLVSSEAPKKAATQPTAATAIAGRSRGESGLAGGASSKVNTARTNAPAEIPATIPDHGRPAFDPPRRPPAKRPAPTAPERHPFQITAARP